MRPVPAALLAVVGVAALTTACSGSAAPRPAAEAGPSPAAAPSGTPAPLPTTVSAAPSPTHAAAPAPATTARPTAAVPTRSAGPTATPPVDPLDPGGAVESPPPLGAPRCRAGRLTLTDADTLVGLEHVQEVFVLRTTGPDCGLLGYPAVRLLGSAGPLPVRVARTGFGLPATTARLVTLSRTTSVSFVVATARNGRCSQAVALVATLPGTGGSLRATTPLQVCGGRVAVGPVHRNAETDAG